MLEILLRLVQNERAVMLGMGWVAANKPALRPIGASAIRLSADCVLGAISQFAVFDTIGHGRNLTGKTGG